MPHLSLFLLGTFEATLDGQLVTAFGSDKARGLLAFLAVESACPHRRAELSGLFWPELTEKRAAHNLSQTLLRLRRALGESARRAQPAPAQAAGEPFLLVTPQDIQFNPRSDHRLDVALFAELLRAVRQHQHPDAQACATCMGWLHQAADLYRGDFLAGFFLRDSVGFEEWRLVQQEGLHQQAVDLLDRLATYHEGRGEDEQVGRYAGQLTALEPWHERGLLQWMRALARGGQTAAALEKYTTYCRVLAEEFGLPPSAEARALYEQIRTGQAGKGAAGWPGSGGPAPRQAVGDRRQVTVLIRSHRDPAGSDDPEAVYERLARCEPGCRAILERYGGHRGQGYGDECLIYFGYPRTYEDAARRAVHAALALIAASEEADPARLGIHTGAMVVGGSDVSGAEGRGPVGDVPVIARGCQALAGPGEVLITAETERLVRGWFRCRELGPRSLPGLAGPIVLYQVLGESETQSRLEWLAQTRGLAAFVGREPELEQLLALAGEARGGKGHAVLIGGEPGIGKSRLLWEFRRALGSGETPVSWLEGRCSPYYQNTSLYPISGLLEQLLGFEDGDVPEVKRDKLERALARCDLAQPGANWLLSLLLGLPADTPTPETITAHQRERMREMFVVLLQKNAAQHPLVVVVEDLHWSDPTTVEWLGRSLDALAAVPCLVLLTHRPTFVSPWTPRANLLALALGPLDPAQAERLSAGVAGERALPGELRRRIAKQTDGVPLFVEELTKTVVGQPDLEIATSPSALQIPATLRDSLMARLDYVGAAKESAQWAAMLGREFAYPLLRAVVPYDEGRLQDDLAALVEADLVQARGRTPQVHFAFKHTLIQEAAYASLLRQTRQDHHRRIAETLEARLPQIAEARPEVLAEHYWHGGVPAQAVDGWLRAGERAVSQGATSEALVFFNRALEQAASQDAERRWRALLGREKVLDLRGERKAQEANLAALLELAEALDDDARRAEVRLRQTACAAIQGDFRAAIPLAEAAGSAAQRAGDRTRELRALAYKAQTLAFFGDMDAGRRAVEESLAQVDGIADDADAVHPSVRALVLTVAAQYAVESGDLAHAVQRQGQGLEAARRAGNYNLELMIGANLGLIYATLGAYARARATLEAVLPRARDVGNRRLCASTLYHLGFVVGWSGEHTLAQQMLEEALQELTETGDVYSEAACRAYLGYILERAGNLPLAAEHLDRARTAFAEAEMETDRIEAQAVAARVALALGQSEEARQWAVEVWQYIREHGTAGIGLSSLVYLCVADVFKALDAPDRSSREVIDAGYHDLMERADRIGDAGWRRSFLENVAESRELVARRQELGR